MAKVIEGLYYSESHEFVRVEGDFGYIGISDYAQEQLGNVVYVDMLESLKLHPSSSMKMPLPIGLSK